MIAATGVIEMINAQAERMFVYSRNELLGQPIEMLVPERYRRNHPHLRTSFFERPVSRWLGAGRDLYGLRKDGGEIPVEIGLNPIETDQGTMVLAAVVDCIAAHLRRGLPSTPLPTAANSCFDQSRKACLTSTSAFSFPSSERSARSTGTRTWA